MFSPALPADMPIPTPREAGPLRVVSFLRTDVSGAATELHYQVIHHACVERRFEIVGEMIGDAHTWRAPFAALVTVCTTRGADAVLTPSPDHLGPGLFTVSAVSAVLTLEPPEIWVRGKRVVWP